MRLLAVFVVLGLLSSSCTSGVPTTEGGSGGAPGTGGKSGTGGTKGSGGAPGTGGKTGTGGGPGTGGNSQTTAAVDCADTSTYTNYVSGQYGATQVSVDNNSNKTYYMHANWWGSPYGQQAEDVSGIGFTITGTTPTNIVSSKPENPLGFPSVFIGSYGSNPTKVTKGSNLPKQVSALTSVPTILVTNVDTMGVTSYNATYDVWLTASSAVVTGNNPGTGGAYLMVWQFKPTDKQPRGTLMSNGSVIKGVKGGWDVWYDSTNPPCVSYVSSNKIADLEFDLKYFIQDAIDNAYGVTTSQYLSIIFAGFEVWGGGDGLQIKKFCANVK
jgi:hypothetical protein